jgi:hypothetical protein
MNPRRLRRRAVRLIAAASLGLGLLFVGGGVAHAQDSIWTVASGSDSGSSSTMTPFDSIWT